MNESAIRPLTNFLPVYPLKGAIMSYAKWSLILCTYEINLMQYNMANTQHTFRIEFQVK